MNRFRSFTLVSVCILLLSAAFPAPAENPKNIHPTGYVTDLASVMAPDTKRGWKRSATRSRRRPGADLRRYGAFVGGESVENFAVDLYKQLGVGSKRDNRGVLLLVAPDERNYRVEVGYGLEPVINDARAGDAGARWCRCCARETTARRSRPRRGCWRKILRRIACYAIRPTPISAGAERAGSFVADCLWGILFIIWIIFSIARAGQRAAGGRKRRRWRLWIGPMLGGMGGGWRGGGFGGSSGGYSGGGGFGGFGGGSSGGGGASGSW